MSAIGPYSSKAGVKTGRGGVKCYNRHMAESKKIVIIGSGSAAYTAAIYAARANMDPLVFGGVSMGGQLMITSEVENFPGFPEAIQGPELMERMQKQVERLGVK